MLLSWETSPTLPKILFKERQLPGRFLLEKFGFITCGIHYLNSLALNFVSTGGGRKKRLWRMKLH